MPRLRKVDPNGLHRWTICSMCGPAVVCGTCGNSCCNGGSGRTSLGIDCDCIEAYKIQDDKYATLKTLNDRELFTYQINQASIIEWPTVTYEFPIVSEEEMTLIRIFKDGK